MIHTEKTPNPDSLKFLSENIEDTFNAISVDSDTSTSDTVLLAATKTAKHKSINNFNDTRLIEFKENDELFFSEDKISPFIDLTFISVRLTK